MKVHIVIGVLAIFGVAGVAAGAVPILPDSPLGQLPGVAETTEPVLVLSPAAHHVTSTAGAIVGAAPAQLIASVRTASISNVERVDHLPTHILLPDGALVASYDPLDPDAITGGVVVTGYSAMAPGPLHAAPLPTARPLDHNVDTSGGAIASSAHPAAAAAPQAPVQTQARVFDPRQTTSGSHLGALIGGGFAIAAVAALGVLLYHRIRPNAALENETRKVIFDAVCGTPGLGVHEISRVAAVSYSTATYHLERLVGAGMIVMTPDGNKLCYYKNGGAFSESERKILPILKNEEAAKLFEAILDAPGTYRAALAERLGVTATTINWHLRRLREAGLVDETRAGRSAHLYARLDALRPTFLALAQKVETSEPITAEKLRRYAGGAPADMTGGVGAA